MAADLPSDNLLHSERLQNTYGELLLEVQVLRVPRMLVWRWHGLIVEGAAAEAAVDRSLALIRDLGIRHLLNDNRNQIGPWPNEKSWHGGKRNQELWQAGIQWWAQLTSRSLSTELSTRLALSDAPFAVNYFHSEAEALDWLTMQRQAA